MPRYRTVLSIFRCPINSWTALRFPVKSLDRYLGLSGWSEPVSAEPLPGPAPDAVARLVPRVKISILPPRVPIDGECRQYVGRTFCRRYLLQLRCWRDRMETSALGSIIAVAMILSGIVGVILGVAVILMVWKYRKDGTAKVTASNPLLLLALVTIFVSMPLLQAANRMDHGNVTLLGFVALTCAGLAWAICCFSLVAIFVKRTRERRGENQ